MINNLIVVHYRSRWELHLLASDMVQVINNNVAILAHTWHVGHEPQRRLSTRGSMVRMPTT
jgi:hypothetical protein